MTAHTLVTELSHLAAMELKVILYGMLALIAYQLLTGRISVRRLFADETGDFSPARIQLLVLTLGTAAAIILHPELIKPDALSGPAEAGAGLAIGGSNLLYLINKYRQHR
jgi:hypothetical protein